jgi:L-lactate dehydrogenase complex protein LldG
VSGERERILSRIRNALGRGPLQAAEREALAQRLQTRAPHPLPHWSEDHLSRFRARAAGATATLAVINSLDALVPEVARYLSGHGLPAELRLADNPQLRGLPWEPVHVATGAGADADRVCLVPAYAGIAESGTVVLLSSRASPTTLNFLPEHHLVVLHTQRILPRMEDLWRELRALPQGMPRTVNLITGPSRTADIEQTIQLGAHGPRHLHLILVRTASGTRPADGS